MNRYFSVDIILMESKYDDGEEYSSRIYDILRCVSIGIAFEDPSTKRVIKTFFCFYRKKYNCTRFQF